jgi:ligand-binding sensor domain-containing protein
MRTYAIISILVFVISCSGQPKAALPKVSAVQQTATYTGQLKLFKTQGSTESDNVHCGLQDRAGNIWFGTTGEGVYRYDGKTFTQFTVRDGLNSNRVWSLLEDRAGNIWIGTNAGVSRFDGKHFKSIPVDTTYGNDLYPTVSLNHNPQVGNEVFSMMQDKHGTIWLGTTEGVYCFNGKSFSRFLDDAGIVNKAGLGLKSVQCMLQDNKGNIWFGSGPLAFEGIAMYNGKSLVNFKPKDETWIRNMFQDKNGDIWFGTRHYGTCRYNGSDFTFVTEKGVGNAMLQDKAGNIWFAGGEKLNTVESEDGIWCYDGKAYKNFSTKDGLGIYAVYVFLEDGASNIWIGTRNNRLYRYDGKSFSCFSE